MLGDRLMKGESEDRVFLDSIDFKNLPNHIAIIMDGNGRWAKKKFLPRYFGHQEGMKRVIDIVKCCSDLGIKYLTLYAFSTENWKRPKKEVDNLMDILISYIKKELNKLIENDVKLNVIGDISEFPLKARNEVKRAMEETKKNTGMNLNIALNYGGRDEIIRATKLIVEDILSGKIKKEDIDDKIFEEHLYTKGIPDPDIIIRPSGEQRLSNFLLWQCAYSEFWYSDICWPDFKEEDLRKAIYDFQNRDRRFGGIK